MGEVIAQSIVDYFADERHLLEIKKLAKAGLRLSMEEEGVAGGSDALAGKTIVISGNFSISRDDMKALIERNGGRNSGSVSAKTMIFSPFAQGTRYFCFCSSLPNISRGPPPRELDVLA